MTTIPEFESAYNDAVAEPVRFKLRGIEFTCWPRLSLMDREKWQRRQIASDHALTTGEFFRMALTRDDDRHPIDALDDPDDSFEQWELFQEVTSGDRMNPVRNDTLAKISAHVWEQWSGTEDPKENAS